MSAMKSPAQSDRQALEAVCRSAATAQGGAEPLLALADRLCRADGACAQARELRLALARNPHHVPKGLTWASRLSRLLPWLAVPLARRVLRRALSSACGLVPISAPSDCFAGDPSARVVVLITSSADYSLALRAVSDFLAARVQPDLILVGAAATDRELGEGLRTTCGLVSPKLAASLADAIEYTTSADRPYAHASFHALDQSEVFRVLRHALVPVLDVNLRPAHGLVDPPAPPEAVDGHWDLRALENAVAERERPRYDSGPSGEGVIRRWLRTPPEKGRSFLRLAADADLAQAHRALDCLVAMRHVWVVSADPALDPYLIERVAKDAAFCEVQTEDVLAEFLQPGDRLRVVGSVGPELARAAARSWLFTGEVTTDPWAELAPYYLPQTIRLAHRGLLQPRVLADTACAPPSPPAH